MEEVNAVARSLLSFVSHYQHEDEAIAAWSAEPQQWMDWGPTRSTCVVACIPAFTDESGHSTGGALPVLLMRSITTSRTVSLSCG